MSKLRHHFKNAGGRRCSRTILALTAALIVALTVPVLGVPVQAADPDLDRGGSVTLKKPNDVIFDNLDDAPVICDIYQVATAEKTGGSFELRLTKDFEGYIKSLDQGNLSTDEWSEKIAQEALKVVLANVGEDDDSGSDALADKGHRLFKGVSSVKTEMDEPGLYLIVLHGPGNKYKVTFHDDSLATCTYYKKDAGFLFSPILVTIPTLDGGKWYNDMNVELKIEQFTLPKHDVPPPPHHTPKTEDTFNMTPYLIAILAGGLLLVVVLVLRSHNKKSSDAGADDI